MLCTSKIEQNSPSYKKRLSKMIPWSAGEAWRRSPYGVAPNDFPMWMVWHLSILNFFGRISFRFSSLHNISAVWVFPNLVQVKHKTTFDPHYYCGSWITFPFIIPSPYIMFQAENFLLAFTWSPIPTLKLSILRVVFSELHTC